MYFWVIFNYLLVPTCKQTNSIVLELFPDFHIYKNTSTETNDHINRQFITSYCIVRRHKWQILGHTYIYYLFS